MSVFVVTWNINKEKSNYANARSEFIKHLDRYANVGEGGLETVRWVQSTSTSQQISDDLRTKLDDNDRIFVSKLAADTHAGWLNKTTWDWITPKV